MRNSDAAVFVNRLGADLQVNRTNRARHLRASWTKLAREFTQETFIRAFERLGAFRGDAAFSTWLHAITTTVVLSGLRKVKRFRQRVADIDDAGEIGTPHPQTEPDLKARLKQAIDELPERCRTVFVMHDVEGYTHEEIGVALGVETGTSKSQLSKARAKLRIALANFAGE